MECWVCTHGKEYHYVTKEASITGCLLCTCRVFREKDLDKPKRGSVEPDVKKVDFTDQAPVTIVDRGPDEDPEVTLKG
jgi:hypothetical protein